MSIWCSGPLIGRDPHEVDPDVHVQVRSYANGWSNHYPNTDGVVERDACIDVAVIPAWCVGGEVDDYEAAGPWLRLGLRSWQHDWSHPADVVGKMSASVVLDEAAVRALAGQLSEWLERPKVLPVVSSQGGQCQKFSNAEAECEHYVRLRAERWAATHFDDTFVDFGDGDWTLLADDGHVLDWGPR